MLAPSARPRGGGLRVALVSEYYYPDVGGLPEHLHHLGRHLARRGHEVTIVTTRFPGAALHAPADPQVEVVRLGRSSGAVITNGSVSRAAVGLGLGRELRALFSARRFDVIHVHGPLFPVLPMLAIRHAPADAALVATLHTNFGGSPVMRLLGGALQRYLDALDAVLTVSESAAESLRRLGLRLDARLVPNGVDLDLWGGGRRLPEFDDGKVNLLVQARLEPRAQIGALIAALAALPAGAFRLLVVGDGPLRAALEGAVPQALAGAVRFLGARIEGRFDLAASSDVYCFTAAIASHPMALLEGMAAGLPVVCYDIEGTRELVGAGVEGHLVPLGDTAAYGAALSALVADPARRRQLGRAARLRAQAFSWPVVTLQIEEAYRTAYEDRMRRISSRMRREPPPSR